MVINYKKLNPNCFHLLRYLQDASLRFIILYGGSSSAKSFSIAQAILIMTLQDSENTKVFRKVGAALKDSIYEAFKEASKTLNVYHLFDFKERRIVCKFNGAKITFSGLDDSEKIKGLENYKRVFLEEFSDFEHGDFKQIRKRLRGKHGQQIICSFNGLYILDSSTGKVKLKRPDQMPKRIRNAMKKITNKKGEVSYEFTGKTEAARLLGAWNGWDAEKTINVKNDGDKIGELRIGFDENDKSDK